MLQHDVWRARHAIITSMFNSKTSIVLAAVARSWRGGAIVKPLNFTNLASDALLQNQIPAKV